MFRRGHAHYQEKSAQERSVTRWRSFPEMRLRAPGLAALESLAFLRRHSLSDNLSSPQSFWRVRGPNRGAPFNFSGVAGRQPQFHATRSGDAIGFQRLSGV
ncbi:hypothetical protein ACFQFQ_17900 [Sulfitobacter porphyrae]|uniref:Uncharacterized protein n=1 Tax=Sulfitobacter porphyrae TaxID=1246864 RepID=A0ABW2B6B2_9RHOB